MRTYRSLVVLAVAALAVGLSAGARAEEEKAQASQLDTLKRLAGDWTCQMKHGDAEHEATVNYKVTAGGSAVVETEFVGTEHEMVTMYHQDGGDLVLTHYCMLGNQPRMKAERGGPADKLTFKFAGAGNLNSEKATHMHDLTLEIVSDDHVKAAWTLYKDGKAAETTTLDMTRKKK